MNIERSTDQALEAFRRGFQPLPIRNRQKQPAVSAWTHLRWSDEAEVLEKFRRWEEEGHTGLGVLLGEPSQGLIDIDLDHPKALRMRDFFLPPTAMMTGRDERPLSHKWYQVTENLPGTRRYRMPDGAVSVELRSTGAQTLLPPSIHPDGDSYRWEGEPWGGEEGARLIDGRVLALQAALLGLSCVLIENWPSKGSRHEAYLAFAGGMLRFGEGVHPYWERNLPTLISAIAETTLDDSGPEGRIQEVMATTLSRLRRGDAAIGFPKLATIIGNDHTDMVRRMAREVEALAGFTGTLPASIQGEPPTAEIETEAEDFQPEPLTESGRDPLGERKGTWQQVDLDPYLADEIQVPQPSVLQRTDGVGLMYEGRVNLLYGKSEAAKSWIALAICQQEMTLGERCLYLDMEDEPIFTIMRLRSLGVGDDDIRHQFGYIRPEEPLEAMQRNRWGRSETSSVGTLNAALFQSGIDTLDPSLIVVDGMTVLYSLHGLDTNDAVGTDVITTWLKRLTRGGRTTVIVIDHTGKSASRGSPPIGAHHKIAMVQGSALQVHPIIQPMPGAVGEVHLVVFKDRPGAVRQVSSDDPTPTAAEVRFDSREKGRTKIAIQPPNSDNVVIGDSDAASAALVRLRGLELQNEIVAAFHDDPDLKLNRGDLLDVLTPKPSTRTLNRALDILLVNRILRKQGIGRGTRYFLEL